jgi:metal-responsive CopG/Arc/MetJ family transcriptional regulator
VPIINAAETEPRIAISLRIPGEMRDELDHVAHRNNVTRADVILQLLRHGLEAVRAEEAGRKAKK